ncbi:MAG TPA: hypothetical protein VM285_09540 [Polyangia bacterium]|nr:hypothetical protein [Polyangia bacterium]
MSESRIRVGTVGLPRRRGGLPAAVDIVELATGRDWPPKGQAARKLRAGIPSAVGFTVQLSRFLAEQPPAGTPAVGDPAGYGRFEPSAENFGLWERCLEHAAALEAEALVLLTPVEFTPTRPNRERLATFLERARRPDVPVAWEPRGPWEPASAAAVALDLGLVLAVDPLRDELPEGPVAYLRLGPFAQLGTRLGTYDLERIADAARGHPLSFCLFETPRALDDARTLREILAGRDPGVTP